MTYRAAIIGTGRIGSLLERDPLRSKPHTHAGWYAASAETRLVAGADLDGDRLRHFGRDWDIAPRHLYDDYREMLRREHPDIVSMCAYAPDRTLMCRAAIDAGARGLWIEKAIACSVAEAEGLATAIEDAGIAAVVNHPRRSDPRYAAVRRAVETEALGTLESVHCLFSGNLIHTGTHAWDLLDFWCGRWSSVEGWLDAPDTADADTGEVSALTGWAARPAGSPSDPAMADRGGRAHITYDSGAHAFVTGGRKEYFVFQFDLVFTRGRIQIGNDLDSVLVPGPS